MTFKNQEEVLEMSDEDFLEKMSENQESSMTGVETDNDASQDVQPDDVVAESAIESDANDTNPLVEDPAPATPFSDQSDVADPVPKDTSHSLGSDESKSSESDKKESAPTESEKTDYEAFYKEVMTPFKANGKLIELRNPAEAVQLMQMGANYTRKMQAIQQHRKVLTMLENNGLLDEGKLSFLIDIEKKNPDAIQKLVKESGIDPLDIDTSEESTYSPGNHSVSEEELNFRSALDELSSNPVGRETLQVINNTWDQASKDVLWKDPATMAAINQQREGGVYDRVVAEIERQRDFGNIPTNVPFLQAYKVIGERMTAEGAFNDLAVNQQQRQQAPKQQMPLATRVAAPKATVAHSDKVSAASPTRSSPKKAEQFVNPLSLSDEEFMKQMGNRL